MQECIWQCSKARQFDPQCGESKPIYPPLTEPCIDAPWSSTDLEQAQALKTLLHQFLYLTFLRHVLVLAERISCLATGIFTEVIVGKLAGLTQKGAELSKGKMISLLLSSIDALAVGVRISESRTYQRPDLETGITVQRCDRHDD